MTARAEPIHFADDLDVAGFITECLCDEGIVARFNEEHGTAIVVRPRGDLADTLMAAALGRPFVNWTPREGDLFSQFVLQNVWPAYRGAAQ